MNNLGTEDFEGFIYLDYDYPVSAWNIARGFFGSVDTLNTKDSMLSIMMSDMLISNNINRIQSEIYIDNIRKLFFPQCVSRLRGVFVFDEVDSVARIWENENWGKHFSDEYLADVGVAANKSTRVDSNWIAHILNENYSLKPNAIENIVNYWSGKPYPKSDPIWERIVSGYITIWSSNIRLEAIKNILSIWKDSFPLLQYSSMCASIGSRDGEIYPCLTIDNNKVTIEYLMIAEHINTPNFYDFLLKNHRKKSLKIDTLFEEPKFRTIKAPDLSGFKKFILLDKNDSFHLSNNMLYFRSN
ncbi:hypothetical protein ACWA5Z_00640 [Testudinibacter sp. P80/BLE/0925]|uniref:hypothetical protein n=1 Tax=Testudinibacter sp. TW-1 TaxID=3417757 RepID=UPI003D36B3E2